MEENQKDWRYNFENRIKHMRNIFYIAFVALLLTTSHASARPDDFDQRHREFLKMLGEEPANDLPSVTIGTQPDKNADEGSPSSSAGNWKTYINPRFGTSVEYPASMFTALPPPSNGDGRTFVKKNTNKKTHFSIFGSHNALNQTVKEMYGDLLQDDDLDAILEKRLQKNEFFVRACHKNIITAIRVIFDDSGVIHFFQMVFPKSESALYNPILKRMVASFSISARRTKTVQKMPKAKTAPVNSTELIFWQSIVNSNNRDDFEAYLSQWPNGVFAVLASNRLKRLRGKSVAMPQNRKSRVKGYYTPARKTAERKAIMNAARRPVVRDIGQKVIFFVSVLRTDGQWAYF